MKKIFALLLTLLFALTLAACGSDDETGSKADGMKLVEDGKFTFAASGEYKPFSYMDGDKMIGYDIAVGEAIADKLGLEPNPVKAKFNGIVTGVKQGRYDAAVASHTITPERLEKVDFSDPYYYSGPQIFTRPDSDIKVADDLKDKEIAVSRGSTYAKTAQDYTDNIAQFDSDVVALQSLAKGHHDAVITDAITGAKAIENGVKIVGQTQLGVSKQAVAVSKDNPELLKAVNKALQELKDSGELAKISKEWIGADITQEPKE